jgi:predicted small integral membrane protein
MNVNVPHLVQMAIAAQMVVEDNVLAHKDNFVIMKHVGIEPRFV